MKVINTSECESCKHCEIDDESIAKVMVYCNVKKKKYHYGQCIQCEYMEKMIFSSSLISFYRKHPCDFIEDEYGVSIPRRSRFLCWLYGLLLIVLYPKSEIKRIGNSWYLRVRRNK